MKLCSAVLPTRGRQGLAAMALDVFYSQTYAEKELIILDDFDEPSFPNGVQHPLVRYYQTENIRYSIPEKRNRVNALAQGDYLWHLDSDDWSSPERMALQVHRLEVTRKAVTGYHTLLFHEERTGLAFEYRGSNQYSCGSSLCYRKTFWQCNKFVESKFTGSDNRFVGTAAQCSELDSVDGGQLLIARIHQGNTSKKTTSGSNYHAVSIDRIPGEYLSLIAQPVI